MKLMLKITGIFVAAIGLFTFLMREEIFKNAEVLPDAEALELVAKLPGEVNESSGLATLANGQVLTHNDAGNKPYLYALNQQGEIQETIKLQLPNVDWEDLTQDDAGNIYIADTGNNNNKRRELAVYKFNPAQPEQVQAIRFTYEDQKEWPPKKDERNFDSEGLFWYNGQLYLISKDRGRGQTAKVYKLPAQPGTHRARLIGSHKLKAQVTGAAISPDASTVALLSEGELHLFQNFDAVDEFYEGKYTHLELPNTGQTEGIVFASDAELLISSEGGNLYRYTLE